MEGTASKLLSRSVAARSAAALIAIGALSLGVTACGSDSSSNSGSTPAAESSVASVVQKEAGLYKNVQLTVVNDLAAGSDHEWFYLCFMTPADCGPGDDGIEPNPVPIDTLTASTGTDAAKVTKTAETVRGELSYPPGYEFTKFTAFNPAGGRPWIELQQLTNEGNGSVQCPCGVGGTGQVPLSEPDAQHFRLGGHSFILSRQADTSNIVMKITVRGLQE